MEARWLSKRHMAASLTSALALLLAAAPLVGATSTTQVISTDPYTNPNSQHQTQVEPDTFSFGSTIVAAFQSGRFFDGGASNIGWATSSDNGSTWTNGFLPGTTVYATPAGPLARISDPSVAFDPRHHTWMIAGLGINSAVVGAAVTVSRSSDGGFTWAKPIFVSRAGGSSFYDKEWISCDTTRTSPFYGNCYVEWDDAFAGDKVYMSKSSDGGRTWSVKTPVPSAFGLGGQPVVQPGGTVIVPFEGNGIQAFQSTDGGTTWSSPVTVSFINTHFVAGGLRTSPLPSAEVDGAGTVYVVWQDCRFESGCSANDIVMSTSSNGTTWSPVARIPIDAVGSGVDHFIPGIGVNRATSGTSAHLALTYYFYPQANCTTSTCQLTVGFINSSDGGATWGTPVTVGGPMNLSDLANTNQGRMVGDYISTSYGSNSSATGVFAIALPKDTQFHENMNAATTSPATGPGHAVEYGPILATQSDHAVPAVPPAIP